MIRKFYCGICKDTIARTRGGLRDHLRKEHLRNNFFNEKPQKNEAIRHRRLTKKDKIIIIKEYE
jgi:hypothetical protein